MGSGREQVTSTRDWKGGEYGLTSQMRKYRSKGNSRNKCSEAKDSFDYLGN